MTDKNRTQKGFTIVELLIATTVLSTILVLVTAMMISIGNLFYKGVNQARIQQSARNITDEISQKLELTGSVITTDPDPSTPNPLLVRAYCIGGLRLTYVIGAQIDHPRFSLTTPTFHHVLWEDTYNSGAGCAPADLTLNDPSSGANSGMNGRELISPTSRLINLNISGASQYEISVGVAYGDDDLLCSPTAAGTCANTTTMNTVDYTRGDLQCAGHVGDQFCATARLNTVVGKRL